MGTLNAEVTAFPRDDPPGRMPGSTAGGTPAATVNDTGIQPAKIPGSTLAPWTTAGLR